MSIKKQKSQKDANRSSGIENSVTAVKRQEEDLTVDQRHRRNIHTPDMQAKIIQTDEEKLSQGDYWVPGLTPAYRCRAYEPVSCVTLPRGTLYFSVWARLSYRSLFSELTSRVDS